MDILDGIDLSQYPPHVQITLKFARDMEGHKPADAALAAVKILAFCAYTGSENPQIVMEATKVLFEQELETLKATGIKPSSTSQNKWKQHLH